jgi:hypothetical protein
MHKIYKLLSSSSRVGLSHTHQTNTNQTNVMDANGAWRIAKVAQQESVDRPTKASMLRALAKLEAYLTRIDSIIAAPKGKRSSWVGNQLERVADAAIVVQDGNSCDGDGNSDGDGDCDSDYDYDDESVPAQSQGNARAKAQAKAKAQAQVQSCYNAARALHLCAQKGLLTHYIASSDPRAEEQAFETNMELFGPRLRPSIRRLRGGDSDTNGTAGGAGGNSGSNENEMESVHGGETDLGMGMDSETPHAALDAVEAALEAALARETLAQSTNASLLAEFEAGLREALAIAPNADVLAGGNVIMHDPGHGEAAQVCIEESVRELYGDFGSDVGASQWKLEVAEVANHF